jgi:hypothetical protein
VTYSRFKRYNVVLDKLVVWLVENRAVAVIAMEEQVEREANILVA